MNSPVLLIRSLSHDCTKTWGFHILKRHVMNKRIANGQLSGKPGTVYDVYLKLKTTEGYRSYGKRVFLRRADALEHVQSLFSMYSCPKSGAIYSGMQFSDFLLHWLTVGSKTCWDSHTYFNVFSQKNY